MREITSEKLIEMIRQADPTGKRKVYIQRDPEGNGTPMPLYGVWACAMNADGEVGYEKLTPELEEEGYSQEDVVEGKKVLVIQP